MADFTLFADSMDDENEFTCAIPVRIAVLTGAGISAESGVKTFRDNDGLWENHRIEDVATPMAWAADPNKVWRFYQQRRRQLLEVEPNPAHEALATLEAGVMEGVLTLVTQNVDDLHERGGSREVIHMHGELRKLRCEGCGNVETRMDEEDLENDDFLTCGACVEGRMRPHIVWFHEMPFDLERIYEAVENCDLFVVVGTSGHVYPAAGLLGVARSAGARCIGFNLEPPENAYLFHEFYEGRAGETLPQWVDQFLAD